MNRPDANFWRGRRVLLTGQTGFKGAWLALWLHRLGADVSAFALPPDRRPSLFDVASVAQVCDGRNQDLRDEAGVAAFVRRVRPQVVFHLAAQSLVRRSLADPMETVSTNVLGTVNLLNALRGIEELDAVLVVTSDKVYANDGSGRPMSEDDPLGGHDPYSASKAACEIIVRSFSESFFANDAALATARAGNVIGGGDFAADRVVPDCVRAAVAGKQLVLRHPNATRPWQHVLDCLCGYLLYTERLVRDGAATPRALNFGPRPGGEMPVIEIARAMLEALGADVGIDIREPAHTVEAPRLALDSTLARRMLGWSDRLAGAAAIEATAVWYRRWQAKEDMRAASLADIEHYERAIGKAE